jgi:succinate dehydrogenase / fumarate reductase cytochrome b subunit
LDGAAQSLRRTAVTLGWKAEHSSEEHVIVAVRARKTKDDYGTLYRSHEGAWSWIAHRISGVAVILFLFVHVVDTALIGWGPDAYNRVLQAYANPIVHLLELGLFLAVLYHSLNGMRITLSDFFPRLVRYTRPIAIGTTLLFFAGAVPVTVIMLNQTIDLWRG